MRTFTLLLMLLSNSAWALVTEVDSVSVTQDMQTWVTEFATRAPKQIALNNIDSQKEAYTECFEVAEIDRAYICASRYQRNMNFALTRASFYIEGIDGPAGTVVKNNDPGIYQFAQMIGGHDLKSQDLLKFWQVMSDLCDRDESYCPTPFENDIFKSFILPRIENDEDFVLITFASQSNMSWSEVVTHEIMHAQFFLEIGFEEVVQNYWDNQVSKRDKELTRNVLGRYYDSSIDYLMMNEFQAYILMAGAEYNLLASLSVTHKAKLSEALIEAGITPVQVQ